MKKEVRSSKFITLWIDTEIEYIEYLFKDSDKMSSEEYVEELKELMKIMAVYKPKKMFGDMSEFVFAISPEIQTWINENLFAFYQEIGFKKIAIILSKEIISEISIEQTMDEDTTGSFQTKFFADQKSAMTWLF